jgi:putative heme iron utilization protein
MSIWWPTVCWAWCTQDVMRMAALIEAGRWEPHEVCSAALEAQFRFVRSPQQLVADAPSAAA